MCNAGDYGLYGMCVQTACRREKAGALARPDSQPYVYRPPVGEFVAQTGMGTVERRFTDRTYNKGEDAKACITPRPSVCQI